jgi:probable HAF family extracellular repeat protein
MNRLALVLSTAILSCGMLFAQDSKVSYKFTDVQFSHDTFTQLLGINNGGKIAGYHNVNENQGFVLTLPNHFAKENYPNSAMTQVIGINNKGKTAGFYVDGGNVTHGFYNANNAFFTVDFPGSAFNQLLGQNDNGQAAGYYSMSSDNTTPDFPYIYDEFGGIFEVITIPAAVGGAQATGVNDMQQVVGFYIDSNNVNHGWLLVDGTFSVVDFPGSTGTQCLGISNKGEIVGFYTDGAGATHGFTHQWNKKSFQTVDDPRGIGMTLVNGVNDNGDLVGFWGSGDKATGFVATPQ